MMLWVLAAAVLMLVLIHMPSTPPTPPCRHAIAAQRAAAAAALDATARGACRASTESFARRRYQGASSRNVFRGLTLDAWSPAPSPQRSVSVVNELRLVTARSCARMVAAAT
jgi:hypothetical protein